MNPSVLSHKVVIMPPKKKTSAPRQDDPYRPTRFSQLSITEVMPAQRNAAFIEIQILNSPAVEPTYGQQVAKHMMLPMKVCGMEPREYLMAWSNSHSLEELRQYEKNWRKDFQYELPDIQFRKGGGHSELQLYVYNDMKAKYEQWSRNYNRNKQMCAFDGDTPEQAIDISVWGPKYRDGVTFVAHYHVLHPWKTPAGAIEACVKILQTEVPTKAALNRYFTGVIKERHMNLALDEMDLIRNINRGTKKKMFIVRRILQHIHFSDPRVTHLGSDRVVFNKIKKWVTDIPANEVTLRRELAWVLEMELEEQPDEKAKRLESEAKEAEKAEKKRKQQEKVAEKEAAKQKREAERAEKKRKREEEAAEKKRKRDAKMAPSKNTEEMEEDDEEVLSDGNSQVGPKIDWESDESESEKEDFLVEDDEVPPEKTTLPEQPVRSPPKPPIQPESDDKLDEKSYKSCVIMPRNVITKEVEVDCVMELPFDEYCDTEKQIGQEIQALCKIYSKVAYHSSKEPALQKSGKGKSYSARDENWVQTMTFHYSLLYRIMMDLTIFYKVDFAKEAKGKTKQGKNDEIVIRCARKCGFFTQTEAKIAGPSSFKNYALSWMQPFMASTFFETMLHLELWLGEYTNSILSQQEKFKIIQSAVQRSGMSKEESAAVLVLFVLIINQKKNKK